MSVTLFALFLACTGSQPLDQPPAPPTWPVSNRDMKSATPPPASVEKDTDTDRPAANK